MSSLSLSTPSPSADSPSEEVTASRHNSFHAAVDRAASVAAARIAPLWPLQNFVAVNPMLGVSEFSLPNSAFLMARTLGARLTMPRSWYAQKLQDETIRNEDIAAAIEELSIEMNVATTVQRVRAEALQDDVPAERFQLPTVATLASRRCDVDWQQVIQGSISAWAGDYFDRGIAVWSAAGAEEAPWPSYQAVSAIDRTAEILGLSDARSLMADLPRHPTALLIEVVECLGIPEAGLVDYFHRLLADVSGWAAYARQRGWTSELRGEDGSAARQFLALRAAWELVLWRGLDSPELCFDFITSRTRYAENDPTLWRALSATDQVLQLAFDRATQRQMAGLLQPGPGAFASRRPDVQAVFCIDVRSERLRRALETLDSGVHTLGFAGFFGLPIRVSHSHAHSHSHSHCGDDSSDRCPVLLEPTHKVSGNEEPGFGLRAGRSEARWRAGRLARLQRGGVGSFAYVEALGLGYLWKLASSVLGFAPRNPGASCSVDYQLVDTLPRRIDLAENMLRGMSLTQNFARLVVFTAHGSTSTNNPHASSLDCGACGGHAGDINARLAAELLNDRFIRAGLIERGIDIPGDTRFVAALHDTTTDQVTMIENQEIDESHQADVERFAGLALIAGGDVRAERAASLGLPARAGLGSMLQGRSRDWSQVRPEWGLAGCNVFIAAPRSRTRDLPLGGRSFLHEYQQEADTDNAVLETILTAPLIVASWITLQYYGSTVDNEVFGSGDKTLHNVVAGIGVLEGLGGDLRSGLPMQSIHNGNEHMHEPLRLMAVIEAPRAAIDEIISRHESLAQLVDNGWIQMHALDANGALWRRARGGQTWKRVYASVSATGKRAQREAA